MCGGGGEVTPLQGFTDIGGLGIQSGFLHRYSPGSFSSPTTERATWCKYSTVQCVCVCYVKEGDSCPFWGSISK